MGMKELIDRLEKATGPDRKLDAAIYTDAIGLDDYWSIHDHSNGKLCLRYYPGPPGPEYHPLPLYTSSIDDALTLVPEQEKYGVSIDFDIDRLQWAASVIGWSYAETIPVALCIAALKAREALAHSPAAITEQADK
jgi:hypothetical protein